MMKLVDTYIDKWKVIMWRVEGQIKSKLRWDEVMYGMGRYGKLNTVESTLSSICTYAVIILYHIISYHIIIAMHWGTYSNYDVGSKDRSCRKWRLIEQNMITYELDVWMDREKGYATRYACVCVCQNVRVWVLHIEEKET